jgi:branched-chain amino acid transport system substrate-binding protein
MFRLLRRSIAFLFLAIAAVATVGIGAAATAAKPIRIGFGIQLTGGIAVNGKVALLAMEIWKDDVNAKGGLLGRPVEFVYYDDQSNPANVPGIYTKLLDVDKVDLIMGGNGTTQVAPLMPVAMRRKRLVIGLFPFAVNGEFKYTRYFAMIPVGPKPRRALTEGFFDLALTQNPKPQTVAIVGTDSEFAQSAMAGARANAKAAGLKIVYDQSYPPSTTEFTSIVRAIQATNPDLVVICSYPPDSVGMVRAVNEVGFKPKMIGGGMVGLQVTAIQTQLGPLLNGFTDYNWWLPIKTMEFPGALDFMKKYQARAPGAGVDPIGYYIAPWGYATMQVLEQAVEATKSFDDGKLADYIHNHTLKTVVGDVKFGPLGEWAQARVLQVQYHNIKGNGIDQFKQVSSIQAIVAPAKYKSGNLIYPYADAIK